MATGGSLRLGLGPSSQNLDGAVSTLAQMPTIHPHLPSSYGIIRSTFQYFSSLQIALRMRGLGVFPINQLAFDERDMQIPEGSEQWYDALAQSPNAVINSYTGCIWLRSSPLECSGMIRLFRKAGVVSPV